MFKNSSPHGILVHAHVHQLCQTYSCTTEQFYTSSYKYSVNEINFVIRYLRYKLQYILSFMIWASTEIFYNEDANMSLCYRRMLTAISHIKNKLRSIARIRWTLRLIYLPVPITCPRHTYWQLTKHWLTEWITHSSTLQPMWAPSVQSWVSVRKMNVPNAPETKFWIKFYQLFQLKTICGKLLIIRLGLDGN